MHDARAFMRHRRKKGQTTDLVVGAVLNGFRAIDTGMSFIRSDVVHLAHIVQ